MKLDEILDKNVVEPYTAITEIYTKRHFREKIFLPWIDRFLEMVGGGKVLDAGCGPGGESRLMAQKGFEVVGIDITDTMIKKAREKVEGAEFRKMDIRKLEFDEVSFDGIWSARALIHVPQKEVLSTLKEWYRVLKPGGVLGLCVLEGEGEGIEPEVYDVSGRTSCFFHYFTKDKLRTSVESAGFVIESEDSAKREGEEEAHLFVIARKE